MKQSLYEEDFILLVVILFMFLLFVPGGWGIVIFGFFLLPVLIFTALILTMAFLLLWAALRLMAGDNMQRKSNLSKAPGSTLLSVVEFLYAPKTVEHIFKPLVADWRVEYFNALQQGKVVKARWITFRYTYSFIVAMGASKALSFIKRFSSAIK